MPKSVGNKNKIKNDPTNKINNRNINKRKENMCYMYIYVLYIIIIWLYEILKYNMKFHKYSQCFVEGRDPISIRRFAPQE